MFKSLYTKKTIEMLSNADNEKLGRYAESMPEGKFWNLHNNQPDKADAIGLQADGTVVALFKYGCSINPLMMDASGKKNWGDFHVALSTSSCGGCFYPNYNYSEDVDWDLSISQYNDSLYSKSKAIVAIWVFPVVKEMKLNLEVDGEVNADLFIIPNEISRIGSFFKSYQVRYAKLCQDLFELNGVEYDLDDFDSEKLVEIWAVSREDLGSDNLGSHGFTMTIDGQEYYCRFPSYLPVRLFSGKKEGEIISLIIPIEGQGDENDDHVSLKMRFNLRLAQTEYRYRGFGKFEDLLAGLLG